MKDLIEALLIIQKYLKNPDSKYPTSCEHDTLYVCEVNLCDMSLEDVHKLYNLGFIPGSDDDYNIVKDTLGGEFACECSYDSISQEQWDLLKNELTDSFYSYRYGSC